MKAKKDRLRWSCFCSTDKLKTNNVRSKELLDFLAPASAAKTSLNFLEPKLSSSFFSSQCRAEIRTCFLAWYLTRALSLRMPLLQLISNFIWTTWWRKTWNYKLFPKFPKLLTRDPLWARSTEDCLQGYVISLPRCVCLEGERDHCLLNLGAWHSSLLRWQAWLTSTGCHSNKSMLMKDK